VSSLNLDALILREDFQVIGEGDPVPSKMSMSIRELEAGEFFSAGLRKPDFQRETSEWDAKRIIGLVRTFVEDQMLPGVILWKNKVLIFVIDGSHRLSALLAWGMDGDGDGVKSRPCFGSSIPDEQQTMEQKAREEIDREVGSYADHRKAACNPEAFGPDLVARARRLSTLTLDLQWVRGDATRAEDSFIRINQQAATITPQELELIKDRRKPMAIAARAIRQKDKGHEYWKNFSPENQALIRHHAVAPRRPPTPRSRFRKKAICARRRPPSSDGP
jgi:hypothetical protein